MILSFKPVFRLCFVLLLLPLIAACNNAEANPMVGQAAPTFSLPAATGETVSLSDYSGQPVLLYFHMAVG